VAAPVNLGLANFGKPSERLVAYHERRSSPQVGLTLVGNVATRKCGRTNPNTLVLTTPKDATQFQSLSARIRIKGSIPGIQLASMPNTLFPRKRWQSPDAEREVGRLQALTLSFPRKFLDEHLKAFIHSAQLAKLAGFDVIQIHAAHGYLLSLLLHPTINLRKDRFAPEGDWILRFFEALRKDLPKTAVSIRLSLLSGIDEPSVEAFRIQHLARNLARVGLDNIDLSSGFYTIDKSLIYPGRRNQKQLRAAIDFARGSKLLVTYSGDLRWPGDFPRFLPSNLLLGVGRALIADPDFLVKCHSGKWQTIRTCKRTNKCHYFSRGRPHIECGRNPEL